MNLETLETPALVIDIDVMERNLERAAGYARSHGLALRPHIKTHKTPELAARQLALGALGLTSAKVSEAEAMMAAQPGSLLLAYPVWGEPKWKRVAALAREREVLIAVDAEATAEGLSAAAVEAGVRLGVLVEIDAGLGRVGTQTAREAALLAARVDRLPGLRFAGINFYPGHIKRLGEGLDDQLEALSNVVAAAKAAIEGEGLEVGMVSGGSTPLLYHSHRVGGLTEIRPGTYVFNDRNTVLCGSCGWADCAATILTTVVSTAKRGQVIIDGGSKTFSSDRTVTGAEGFGVVLGQPDAVFVKMNEEHGFIRVPEDHGLRVGDRLRVIPNHVCVAVNLHERMYGIRGERVEAVWTVAARGKLQ